MAKKTFPLSEVYRLLEPGPVVMVSTAHKGKANIMTMSWQTMMEFAPPLVGCVISGRNHSFDALVATRECVLNIPSVEMAKQVVGVGNCSGSKVDKFRKFKLTAMPASKVAPPLIDECFANLECRVYDTRMVNKYNFFVLEVVKAWIDPAKKNPRTLHHQGKGYFAVDGDTIKLSSKMA
ncbi:flavin reductase family protein [Sideroxydans lithotrophicus]|uniref:Flavin reductase domain protein FMN-binding protein n=1 Tax=Sideroxydans lithotrophicus (strain ES-1) TaxID=580332 RepID=D5CRG8_SIDLE|nr:flavin reductase family protein [Sideroxydans lithotrophicus]ADE11554.1 flavin reductase domain protein FMN-binding protein [Sideroxydans lithotrophicus ES-1]